jgi:hypothetical protein
MRRRTTRALAVRSCLSTRHVENLRLGAVMNQGRTAIALRGGVTVFVLVVGCGALPGVMSTSSASPTPTTTSSAVSREAAAPSGDPGGPSGGALPVAPAHGGCIIGLNCGCIRGFTCPGTILHHRPAPTNDRPHGAPGGPAGGGG